jgi:protein TonB
MVDHDQPLEAIVFSQLIASRPARSRSLQGTTVSLAFHGALITLAILVTAQTQTAVHGAADDRVVVIDPYRPPRPAAAVEPPRATAPPAPQPATPTPPAAPVPRIAAPTEVPSAIPSPSIQPVFPAAPTFSSGETAADPNAPFLPGEPWGGVRGAAEVDVPVSLLPRSPLPRYPEALRPQRLVGGVRMAFIVGTDGRVEMRTVRIVESTHPAFTEAVRSTLPRMRFRPARVGDRAVRQLVEFPVAFRIDR